MWLVEGGEVLGNANGLNFFAHAQLPLEALAPDIDIMQFSQH